LNNKVMEAINNIFYSIGKGVAYHPFACFLGGILATIAFGFGFINLRVTVSENLTLRIMRKNYGFPQLHERILSRSISFSTSALSLGLMKSYLVQ